VIGLSHYSLIKYDHAAKPGYLSSCTCV
jgi:hypothetical protein